jgi:hypothetical protein
MITEKYGHKPLEEGAQAVFLGATDPRHQRIVGLALPDAALKQQLRTRIAESGAGFVRSAEQDEAVDLQVALDDKGLCYEIWDRTGTQIPNLRPPINATDVDATERIVKRLVHLAKYLNIQALNNSDPTSSHKLRIQLVGSPSGGERWAGTSIFAGHQNNTEGA